MDPYKYEKHEPVKRRWAPWVMCKWCGLIYLNNDFTRWCVKMGCNNAAHPDHKKAR